MRKVSRELRETNPQAGDSRLPVPAGRGSGSGSGVEPVRRQKGDTPAGLKAALVELAPLAVEVFFMLAHRWLSTRLAGSPDASRIDRPDVRPPIRFGAGPASGRRYRRQRRGGRE